MSNYCGLVNKNAKCHCRKRIKPAINNGRIDPDHLLFAAPSLLPDDHQLKRYKKEMEHLHDTATIFRSQPQYESPSALRKAIRDILNSDTYNLLR